MNQSKNREFRVQPNQYILRLELFDEKQLTQLSSQRVGGPSYFTNRMLGIACSTAEYREFASSGRCSANLMGIFLSYIYNHDLLASQPTLPYFVLARQVAAGHEIDDVSQSLRARRRRKDHNLITIVLRTLKRWVLGTFDLISKNLVFVDMHEDNVKDEETLKGIIMVSDICKSTLQDYFDVQEYEFESSVHYESDEDGSIFILDYLYQLIVRQVAYPEIVISGEGIQAQLNWVLCLTRHLEEKERYQQANRKLGAQGNPNLPRLNQFDEDEYQTLLQAFETNQTDPYLNSILGPACFRNEIVDFEQGAASPAVMASLMNYIYNNDMFTDAPTYPYFIMASNETEFNETLNQCFKSKRRKLDHDLICILLYIQGKWNASMFSLKIKKLHLIAASDELSEQELKSIMINFGKEKLLYKYDVQDYAYHCLSQGPTGDGSALLVHFMYEVIICERKPEQVKLKPNQTNKQLLWLLHRVHKLENPHQAINTNNSVSIYSPSPIRRARQQNDKILSIAQERNGLQAVKQNADDQFLDYVSEHNTIDPIARKNSQESIQQDSIHSIQGHRRYRSQHNYGKQPDELEHQSEVQYKINDAKRPSRNISQSMVYDSNPKKQLNQILVRNSNKSRQGNRNTPQEQDVLDRIYKDMEQVYVSDGKTSRIEPKKLAQIDTINEKIQKKFNPQRGRFLSQENTKNPPQLVVNAQKPQHPAQFNQLISLLDRRQDIQNNNLAFVRNSYKVPKEDLLVQYQTANKLTKVQSLVIDRFGITISAEDLSSFKGTMRTPKHILNFLMSLFQEKIHHDLLKEGTGQRVRVFTTAFYNALTGNQLLSSRIFYEEASKFTFENIGQGKTIFDIYDWLVVPIAELPCEYSVIVVNMRGRVLNLFQLSSMASRLNDTGHHNADRNAYLCNMQRFLQMEYETKCIRQHAVHQKFLLMFGFINRDPYYQINLNVQYSGLYALSLISHVVRNGHLNDIAILEFQLRKVCDQLHDLILACETKSNEIHPTVLKDMMWPS